MSAADALLGLGVAWLLTLGLCGPWPIADNHPKVGLVFSFSLLASTIAAIVSLSVAIAKAWKVLVDQAGVVTIDDALKVAAAIVAVIFFVVKWLTGHFSENLEVEFSVATGAHGTFATVGLRKTFPGSIRLVSATVTQGSPEGTPDKARPSFLQDSGLGAPVLSGGDATRFTWKLAERLDAGAIAHLTIEARKWPVHNLWYLPGWKSSACVSTLTS